MDVGFFVWIAIIATTLMGAIAQSERQDYRQIEGNTIANLWKILQSGNPVLKIRKFIIPLHYYKIVPLVGILRPSRNYVTWPANLEGPAISSLYTTEVGNTGSTLVPKTSNTEEASTNVLGNNEISEGLEKLMINMEYLTERASEDETEESIYGQNKPMQLNLTNYPYTYDFGSMLTANGIPTGYRNKADDLAASMLMKTLIGGSLSDMSEYSEVQELPVNSLETNGYLEDAVSSNLVEDAEEPLKMDIMRMRAVRSPQYYNPPREHTESIQSETKSRTRGNIGILGIPLLTAGMRNKQSKFEERQNVDSGVQPFYPLPAYQPYLVG